MENWQFPKKARSKDRKNGSKTLTCANQMILSLLQERSMLNGIYQQEGHLIRMQDILLLYLVLVFDRVLSPNLREIDHKK